MLATYLYDHFESNTFPIKITIERYVSKRSLSQNALVHVWFTDIATQIGDTPSGVKDDVKQLFAPQIEGPLGVMRPMNTSEMDTVQMVDFMTAIQAKGAEMGWELSNAG